MFGAIASLIASLTLIVLPVSAPCVCHGFTFFGGGDCCASGAKDVKERTAGATHEQPRRCHCGQGNTHDGESREDWIPACAGMTLKRAQPREDDRPTPCPECPRSEHKEVHNLSLLQPTPVALIDVTQAVNISAAWFLPSVISHPADNDANLVRHDADRILVPPPLRFIEPMRLLI